MTFERTGDIELVRSVLTHPQLYRWMGDDTLGPVEEFRVNEHPLIWHVAVWDGAEFLGLLLFYPQNSVCWDLHVALLPCCWGVRTRPALRECFEWMWRVSDCQRIVGAAPADNERAVRLVRDVGMTQFGVNEQSFLRGGVLVDQILFGISK